MTEKRKTECLRLSEEETQQVIALLGLIDEVTEELRIRRQEIFAYEGKEEQLKLELKSAELNGEIMKILRKAVRNLKMTVIIKYEEKDGGVNGDKVKSKK
jgi:hypothetical protein